MSAVQSSHARVHALRVGAGSALTACLVEALYAVREVLVVGELLGQLQQQRLQRVLELLYDTGRGSVSFVRSAHIFDFN